MVRLTSALAPALLVYGAAGLTANVKAEFEDGPSLAATIRAGAAPAATAEESVELAKAFARAKLEDARRAQLDANAALKQEAAAKQARRRASKAAEARAQAIAQDPTLRALDGRVSEARLRQERLLAEGGRLRQELDSWRGVGQQVAAHEMRLARMLARRSAAGRGDVKQPAPSSAARGPSNHRLVTHPLRATSVAEGAAHAGPGFADEAPTGWAAAVALSASFLGGVASWLPVDNGGLIFQSVAIAVALAILVATCLYSKRALTAQKYPPASQHLAEGAAAKPPPQGAEMQAPPKLPRKIVSGCGSSVLGGLARWADAGVRMVEVSELQVGNLPISGEIYVRLSVDGVDGEWLITEAVRASKGRLLRFDTVLVAEVFRFGGALVLSVVDKSARGGDALVAQRRIQAKDVLTLVTSDPREYFRFKLSLGSQIPAEAGEPPFVAARLRERGAPSSAPRRSKVVKGPEPPTRFTPPTSAIPLQQPEVDPSVTRTTPPGCVDEDEGPGTFVCAD